MISAPVNYLLLPLSLSFSLSLFLSLCLLPLLWEGKKLGVNSCWSYILLMHPHKRLRYWRACLDLLLVI